MAGASLLRAQLPQLPVAQAAWAAVAAVTELEVKPKVGCALVAAAVRGAAALLPLAPREGPTDLAWVQESVLHMLDSASIGQAAWVLRRAGEPALAARIQRLSKGRNAQCHPDTGLLRDVAAYVAGTVSYEDEGSSGEPDGPAACARPRVLQRHASEPEKEPARQSQEERAQAPAGASHDDFSGDGDLDATGRTCPTAAVRVQVQRGPVGSAEDGGRGEALEVQLAEAGAPAAGSAGHEPRAPGLDAIAVHLQRAAPLKEVVDLMKGLCVDVNFDCSEKGLLVQAMDDSQVAMVSLLLRESAFLEFRCARPTSLCINVDSLAKILRMCGPSDSLWLRWRGNSDTISFHCASGEEGRIVDSELKLMPLGSERIEIRKQYHCVTAKLPSAEFLRICRGLEQFGGDTKVSASKEGITFSVQGDVGAGGVTLRPRESVKPGERVGLTVLEPVTVIFALRYLEYFAKAAPLSEAVELGLGPGAPLSVKYDLGECDDGHVQLYLAPRTALPVRAPGK